VAKTNTRTLTDDELDAIRLESYERGSNDGKEEGFYRGYAAGHRDATDEAARKQTFKDIRSPQLINPFDPIEE
jgi:flagellar biosynthesis/type III secretory pathway protein FliH